MRSRLAEPVRIGQVFGRLTVLERVPDKGRGGHRFRCRCSCGNTTETNGYVLRVGDSSSCGCRRSEVAKQKATTHGHCPGGGHSLEYGVWSAMLARVRATTGRRFEYYGARGITVCDRWLKFENFLADMGPRPSPEHSIDRKSNDGNYEPGNCRWATKKEQAENRRTSLGVSGIRGVRWHHGAWAACVRSGGKTRYLGSFQHPGIAELAVQVAKANAGAA